jgi:hypothetical protein
MEKSSTILKGIELYEKRSAKIQRKARQFSTKKSQLVLAKTDADKAPTQYLKRLK